MKHILSLLLFLFSFCAHAETFKINDALTIEGNVLASSSTCTVVAAYDENCNIYYWVLSEIANQLLPDIAHFVCVKIAGENNQHICDAIETGISFLTALHGTGSKTFKLATEFSNLIASKGTTKSSLYFAANTIDLAFNIKNTLEAYEKLGLIEWESIRNNINRYNNYVGSVMIENVTNTQFTFTISADGINWSKVTIDGGRSKEIIFKQGYTNQKYGFCKGIEMCNYQIYTNKTYKLRYNNIEKKYYIVEK